MKGPLRRCATCRQRIRPHGQQTECRRCARMTERCRNSLACAVYLKRKKNQVFCTSLDIAAIFADAARLPAQSAGKRR